TRKDDASFADTTGAPVRLIDGYRSIELDWETGNGTGKVDIYVDGFLCDGTDKASSGSGAGACASIASLSNSAQRINYVRWGAPANVSVTSTGFGSMDDFVSQRSGYIGAALPFPNDTAAITNATSGPGELPRAVQGIYEAGLTNGCQIGTYC